MTTLQPGDVVKMDIRLSAYNTIWYSDEYAAWQTIRNRILTVSAVDSSRPVFKTFEMDIEISIESVLCVIQRVSTRRPKPLYKIGDIVGVVELYSYGYPLVVSPYGCVGVIGEVEEIGTRSNNIYYKDDVCSFLYRIEGHTNRIPELAMHHVNMDKYEFIDIGRTAEWSPEEFDWLENDRQLRIGNSEVF